MSSSDLSDLSSSLSNGEDIAVPPASKGKLEHYFKQGANTISTSPPAKKKRPPSPPYEYVLADNENIPVSLLGGASMTTTVCASTIAYIALLT